MEKNPIDLSEILLNEKQRGGDMDRPRAITVIIHPTITRGLFFFRVVRLSGIGIGIVPVIVQRVILIFRIVIGAVAIKAVLVIPVLILCQ